MFATVVDLEMHDVPSLNTLAVQNLGPQNLIDQGPTGRDVVQASVEQAVQTILLVPVHIAPERAVSHARKTRGLLLGQAIFFHALRDSSSHPSQLPS